MRTAKRCQILIILLLLAFLSAGCGNRQEEDSKYKIYYLNNDKTKTIAVGCDVQGEERDDMIRNFLERLFMPTENLDYRQPVPEGVRLDSWILEEGQLYLYFNSAYLDMDNLEEVLCRAAIVRTLIQVEGVDCISFYVGDAPLVDDEGKPIGLMTEESFIENPGEQINSIQTASITLYFSNSEGNALIQKVQEIHYSSNISLEKLVIEQLLKGPQDDEGCWMACVS